MAWVFSEIFRAVNNVALAAKVVDSVWNALSIDILLSTGTKVLLILKANRPLDASLKHFT